MARNNALITPQILTWARERLGLSLEEAAEYLDKRPEILHSWEVGDKYPTVNQAKEIAGKLKIPYVFFFLPDPPQNIRLPKNKDYRTFSNQPLKKHTLELTAFLFDIMQRREVVIELYRELEIKPRQFDFFFDANNTDDKTIAKALRTLLKIPQPLKLKGYEAFNFFRDALESIGILVFQAVNIEPAEMRGISILEEQFPVIAVNRKDSVNARIFTLMHELAHLITATAGICDTTGMSEQSSFEIELQCNHIAAQILVPDELIKNNNNYSRLLYGFDDALVREIANVFSVSREVILGRMLLFKDITRDFYLKKLEQYTQEYIQTKQKKKEGGFMLPSQNKESQLGKTYISTVLTAYNQEVITAREAIQYFDGLRLKHFEKLERWCFA